MTTYNIIDLLIRSFFLLLALFFHFRLSKESAIVFINEGTRVKFNFLNYLNKIIKMEFNNIKVKMLFIDLLYILGFILIIKLIPNYFYESYFLLTISVILIGGFILFITYYCGYLFTKYHIRKILSN